MEEEWRPIDGFDQIYQVSNLGRVKTLEHIDARGYHRNEKIHKQTNNGGYRRVTIGKAMLVHRLVAMAFIPNPNGYTEINHKDENKSNNHASNLEWCDKNYNNKYGTRGDRIGKANSGRFVNHPATSKEVFQYDLENNLINVYPSTSEAERDGYNHRCISNCCLGKTNTHKGYKWSYTPL